MMIELVGSFVGVTSSGQNEVSIAGWLVDGDRVVVTQKGHWDLGEIIADTRYQGSEAARAAAELLGSRDCVEWRGKPGKQGLLRHRDFDPVNQAPEWATVSAERVGELLGVWQKPTPR
jgi:hypothetical protein